MTQLAGLHARITGDSSGFVTAATQAQTAAIGAEKAIGGGLAGSTSKLKGAFTGLSRSPAMRMLPMQFSQVAQQAAAGGGVMRALTIQAADIGLAFGTVGTILGIVATVTMPAIINAFSDGDKEADQFEKAVEDLQDAVKGLEGSLAIIEMSAEDLVDKYGLAAEAVRGFALDLAQLQLAEANDALRASVDIADDFIVKFGRSEDVLNRFAVAGDRAQALSAGLNATIKELGDELGVTEDQAKSISKALGDLGAASTLDETTAAADNLSEALKEAGVDANDLPEELRNMLIELRSAQIEAAELAGLMERVAQATHDAAAGAAGVTFGGGMSQLMAQMSGDQLLPPARSVLDDDDDDDKPTRGGKSAAERDAETFKKNLERLQDQLSTELELEQAMHDQRNEMLRKAKENDLLTQVEYADYMERENKRHAQEMAAIDAYRYGTQAEKMGQFMGEMATAFAQGNEEMMQIAKVFGAGEALINAWRTFGQIMASPELSPWQKLPMAVGAFAQVIGAVSAIQGVGKGGSGKKTASGGGGAPAAPEAAGGGGAQRPNVSLTLIGDSGFSRAQIVQIAEALNDSGDEGQNLIQIRGRR